MVGKFTTESLIRAMAPLHLVIENFQYCYHSPHCTATPPSSSRHPGRADSCHAITSKNLGNHTVQIQSPHHQPWGEETQGAFAELVYSIIQLPNGKPSPYQPTNRYMRKLLQRVASHIEKVACIENESFVELMMEYQLRASEGDDDVPDPSASCHVSFCLPSPTTIPTKSSNDYDHPNHIVGIQVYPHHNDVGVRRVWEAGAALAEYLVKRPELVRNKNVCELGAGVGLTGIVIAGLCDTKSVHMTDYTDATLVNMEFNVAQNRNWIKKVRRLEHDDVQPVTTGYLEWEQFSEALEEQERAMIECTVPTRSQTIHQPPEISKEIAKNADVLVAADVVYDRSIIPALISCVSKLLSDSPDKLAVFATTFRNEKTFNLLEEKLKEEGIRCSYAPRSHIESLPRIFPCYFVQPRTDVRICTMTKGP